MFLRSSLRQVKGLKIIYSIGLDYTRLYYKFENDWVIVRECYIRIWNYVCMLSVECLSCGIWVCLSCMPWAIIKFINLINPETWWRLMDELSFKNNIICILKVAGLLLLNFRILFKWQTVYLLLNLQCE